MDKVNAEFLNTYLHEHIPLSSAMGVRVTELAPHRLCLQAPLAPNINHRETVFGGSASAAGILAAWSLLYASLHREGLTSRVVIQRNTMSYDKPITGDFTACATLDVELWRRFLTTLRRRGKSRISVSAQLLCNHEPVGTMQGEFVALGVASVMQ